MGPLLFLVIINDQHSELQLFFSMLTDDQMMRDKTAEVGIIQVDSLMMAEWAFVNVMFKSSSQGQHIQVGSNPSRPCYS